jgi:transcriptional regulator GlxA family with amidase domain
MLEGAIAHSTRGVFAVGIRMRPGHAQALLGIPCGELVKAPVAVRDILPEVGSALLQRIAEASRARERLTLLEAVLLARFERLKGPHPGVLEALRMLEGSNGNIDLDPLLQLLDVSGRQVERLFYQHVGVTPKRMSQILRVQRAIGLARVQTKPTWASIALKSGFYDQAHLIRLFKSVTGTTPARYFTEPSLKLSEI